MPFANTSPPSFVMKAGIRVFFFFFFLSAI
jgi:hypothetical protein